MRQDVELWDEWSESEFHSDVKEEDVSGSRGENKDHANVEQKDGGILSVQNKQGIRPRIGHFIQGMYQ